MLDGNDSSLPAPPLSNWWNTKQGRNKIGSLVCHDATFHSEYNQITESIYLGGLLAENTINGHGNLGVKLIQECQRKNQQLTGIFAIMTGKERSGEDLQGFTPVPDQFWFNHGATPAFFEVKDETLNFNDDEITAILKEIDEKLNPNTEANKQIIAQGKTPCVYIHCNIGVGRSVSILTLYLCCYLNMNFIDALLMIQNKRWQINPNQDQIDMMLRYLLATGREIPSPEALEKLPFCKLRHTISMGFYKLTLATTNIVKSPFEFVSAGLNYAWGSVNRPASPDGPLDNNQSKDTEQSINLKM